MSAANSARISKRPIDPQYGSQPKSPAPFQGSFSKENMTDLSPAEEMIPETAVTCSHAPGHAAPLHPSPLEGHPVSKLIPVLPEQSPSTIESWPATKLPASEAAVLGLKKGWMLQPTTSTTPQRVPALACQMSKGSVVVI